jgi:ABC-type lipoprotein release transport system permease subunit
MMNQPLRLSDVRQGFAQRADQDLLDQLRELLLTDRPMSGITDPQQAAVIAGFMELFDPDNTAIFAHLEDFTKCFRLAHDYVVKHGALWTETADQAVTVSHGTADKVAPHG